MSTKYAVPISYGSPQTKIGSVDVVASEGPPLSVRKWTVADGEDNKHIAIEFEDIIKTLEKEQGLSDTQIMRLCLHLSDARKLTHNLISRLAESGDRVAKLIQEHMNDSMQTVRALENAPIALCDLKITGRDLVSFKLTCPVANQLNVSQEFPIAIVYKTEYGNSRFYKEQIHTILRIIKKHAQLFGLLLKIQDQDKLLEGIDLSILKPYNEIPSKIV